MQYRGLFVMWIQVAQAQIMLKKKELHKAEALLIKVSVKSKSSRSHNFSIAYVICFFSDSDSKHYVLKL
jgi:hypothetical protein